MLPMYLYMAEKDPESLFVDVFVRKAAAVRRAVPRSCFLISSFGNLISLLHWPIAILKLAKSAWTSVDLTNRNHGRFFAAVFPHEYRAGNFAPDDTARCKMIVKWKSEKKEKP